VSFYKDNTDVFYLGEGKKGWTFKNYAKNIGEVVILNVSESPINMKKIPEGDKFGVMHIIASRLTHIELIEDNNKSKNAAYLLLFESGIQVVINAVKTEEDGFDNVESFLSAPTKRATTSRTARAKAVASPAKVIPINSPVKHEEKISKTHSHRRQRYLSLAPSRDKKSLNSNGHKL